jgi:hypothetical protein
MCGNSIVCGFDGFDGFVSAIVCSIDNNIVGDFEAGYPPRGECLVGVGTMSRGYLSAA